MNGENKIQLIQLIGRYLSTEGSTSTQCPVIFTVGDETFKTEFGTVEMLYKCNHEEADTRLIPRAIQCRNDVVIVSKETDVLLLLVWAYSSYNIAKEWYMMYDKINMRILEQYAVFLVLIYASISRHFMHSLDVTKRLIFLLLERLRYFIRSCVNQRISDY